MNSPTTTFTAQTAPRDLNKLVAMGPFLLKRLMEQVTSELKVEFDESARAAFMRDPIDKRAKDVLELLLQLDKGGGGKAAAPAEQPAATEAKAEKPKRDPRPAPATNGVSHAASAPSGSEAEAMKLLEGIARVIEGISGSMEAMQKTIASAEKGTKRITELEAALVRVANTQMLTLAVLSQMAEAQLGAPFADIAAQCLAEKDTFNKTVETLFNSGK